MDLSIIILSYNTKNITDECLRRLQVAVDSVQKKNNNKVEVIVLDNASADGSVEMIKSKQKWVNLIESKTNTGYSKGNNIGFKNSKYPLILFLNSDVYVEEDTLQRSLEYFKNPNCDVLGIQLRYGDGSFQPSAGNLPTPLNTISWILGLSLVPIIKELTNPFHPNYKSFFVSPTGATPVGWVSGAFFMARKAVFEKVGGFDESIFMYLEEVELCKRINMAGFKIWYVSSIFATHLHGASIGFESTSPFVRELKGLKYYFQKYYSLSYFMVKLLLILGLILRIVAFSLLGKTKRARAYIEGLAVI